MQLTATLTPTGSRVLVRVDEAQDVTPAGIILPEQAKEVPKTGVIDAIGPGTLNFHTGYLVRVRLQEGMRVVFSAFAGSDVKVDGEEFLIVEESEILGVIGEE